MSSDEKTAASIPRHEDINTAITNHLESAVSGLERLVAQVRGGDQSEAPSLASTTLPLSDFLGGAASNISDRVNRINIAINELRESLF